MTFKTFAAGDVFTADDADLLMRQGIPVVANQAARDLIPNPSEGMRVYRLDTHSVDMHNGTQWVTGAWQTISVDAPYTSILAVYAVRDNRLVMRGQLQRSSTIPTNAYETVLQLPAWATPKVYTRCILGGDVGSAAGSVILNISASGEVQLRGNGASAANAYLAPVNIPLD